MRLLMLEATVHANARALCDKHLPSQISEAVQFLAIAFTRHNEARPSFNVAPNIWRGGLTDVQAIWVSYSIATYMWTWRYAVALCVEYAHRYKCIHAYEADITTKLITPPKALLDSDCATEWLPPPQNFDRQYMRPYYVEGYRQFYMSMARDERMEWGMGRQRPLWFKPESEYSMYYDRTTHRAAPQY